MSSGKQRADEVEMAEEEEDEQFITEDDILEEVAVDDDDHPMDEDDENDEADDVVGDMAEGSSAHVQDISVQHFETHTASVFAVACHPTQPLAASGGEDDLGYIWDITDGEIIVKLTGHTDSVTNTAWSSDGEMLATGGMDGRTRIWRRVGKENYNTWEFLTELQGPDEVTFLRWHPKGAVLLAGSNDSTLWLWQLPSGNTMQVFSGHTGPVNCGEFTPDGKRIISGDQQGNLIFWDPRSSAPLFKLTAEDARFDLDGIVSLAVNPASTLAVVGGAAGGVRVVSLSKGKVINALGGHAEGESIEAITFVDLTGVGADPNAPGVVVTGGTDGKALVWDLSTMRQRSLLKHDEPVTALVTLPAPKAHLLVSASADGSLRTWDARDGKLLRTHTGHRAAVLSASLGLDGSVVVSGGDDSLCMVFTTEKEEDE